MFFTTSPAMDGFGAQYQRIICQYIILTENNKKFHYTPFTTVEHNYDNSSLWITKLENLINLKYNIPIINKNNKYQVVNLGIIFKKFESEIDKYCDSKSMQFIKNCFWKNKERNVFKNDKINIAVHVRRPNAHDSRLEGANTPDPYYLNIMKIIREKYKDKNLLFHIYSQGNPANFKKYESEDVQFHINEDICKTFIGMVAADILVTSASSFSYVAALLNDGEVYYKNFWHKPRKGWNIY